jgi:hypothetical protein
MLRVRLSWAEDGGKDLVSSMLYVRRSIRFVEYSNFQFNWPKLIESPPVNSQAIIID